MTTLTTLKHSLRRAAKTTSPHPITKPLSPTQQSHSFTLLLQGTETLCYTNFIIPHLHDQIASLLQSPARTQISVLEIGPGDKSILGYLPIDLRRRIRRYVAYEANLLAAGKLEMWLGLGAESESEEVPFPCLEGRAEVHGEFEVDSEVGGTFDLVLFCHSLYWMQPKHAFIRRAIELLVDDRCQYPEGGKVVIFHRDGEINFDGLVCDSTALYPMGMATVVDEDEALGAFASLIAGFVMRDGELDEVVRGEWIRICRALSCGDEAYPGCLLFCSPQAMVTFTRGAMALSELVAQVPLVEGERMIKSWEARLRSPAAIVRPTGIQHVRQCVLWALKHHVGLTVLGGGHGGHCLWPNVVSIDMSAFDQVHVVKSTVDAGVLDSSSNCTFWVTVESGCKTEDIVRKTMAAGVVVPLGSRPSVGAGLWLQGGIGHLGRSHGLACDNIIGAVMISVDSGQIIHVGQTPSQHVPADSIRPKNERDLLWALKGAGTNFGIVISVTFRTHPAPIYSVRNWAIPLKDNNDAQLWMRMFDDRIAKRLPRHYSTDAYLYWENNQLHLGITMYESSLREPGQKTPEFATKVLGSEKDPEIVNGIGMFETEMYMSAMHGGHGSGKTSSFKRCLFLKNIGEANIVNILISAIQNRPSPFCYLHLLQGGGAIDDLSAEAAAFGCRNWDFACVITGVWPRDQNGSELARNVIQWVYNIANKLLPSCNGVYGADLGPDPRDASLALKAFGPNLERLARLKHDFDPYNVLAYVCPLPKPPKKQKLVILVTGCSGVGKDYCADIWVSAIIKHTRGKFTARSVSISDATKREYARATGADLNRLLSDRAYKEQHRPALTKFFQDQVRQRPQLPAEHFQNIVESAADFDVLFITGMRDEAPVATFSHLVPGCRVLDIRIETSQTLRYIRQGLDNDGNSNQTIELNKDIKPQLETLSYRPTYIFDNESAGEEAADSFAKRYFLPFLHENLQHLSTMVTTVPDFPRPGIKFRHVLNIAQQPGGLPLCTSLLQSHFHQALPGETQTPVSAIACCEAGGYIFASALAVQLHIPLLLAREAGKLPHPLASVMKSTSHISSEGSAHLPEKRFEMNRDVVGTGSSVVIVDDVLATGRTLCAMIRLVLQAGVCLEHVSVVVVAEFPVHCGRRLLYECGFGGVDVQSLLVFDGA